MKKFTWKPWMSWTLGTLAVLMLGFYVYDQYSTSPEAYNTQTSNRFLLFITENPHVFWPALCIATAITFCALYATIDQYKEFRFRGNAVTIRARPIKQGEAALIGAVILMLIAALWAYFSKDVITLHSKPVVETKYNPDPAVVQQRDSVIKAKEKLQHKFDSLLKVNQSIVTQVVTEPADTAALEKAWEAEYVKNHPPTPCDSVQAAPPKHHAPKIVRSAPYQKKSRVIRILNRNDYSNSGAYESKRKKGNRYCD